MPFRSVPLLVLAVGVNAALASAEAIAQPLPNVPPPPLVLSHDLTGPWVAQLTPGPIPIYRAPVRLPVSARADVSAPPAFEPPPLLAFAPPTPPPAAAAAPAAAARHPAAMSSEFTPQEVTYAGTETPGTVIIDTNAKFLYLVEANGMARRYGVGVGRPGFTWAGVHQVSRKAEWPDWYPPEEMRQRQPGLPTMMPGGPENPLGARALYLGDTLYRIHGTSQPWTIGHAVSSGCIRMRNEDVTDLYGRVPVGTKVVVM